MVGTVIVIVKMSYKMSVAVGHILFRTSCLDNVHVLYTDEVGYASHLWSILTLQIIHYTELIHFSLVLVLVPPNKLYFIQTDSVILLQQLDYIWMCFLFLYMQDYYLLDKIFTSK